MATYVIGDIQGCWQSLQRLLAQIQFDPRADRIWLVGDLVNRGPDSLSVLRWAIDQGDRVVAILGNHDLRLLAQACGIAEPRPNDTLDAVFAAKERDDLVAWVASRPLLHHEHGVVMIHAGLWPAWSVADAEQNARAAEAELRGPRAEELLAGLRRASSAWDESLQGIVRHATTLAGLTRLRACTDEGRACGDFTGAPKEAPPGCRPWFEVPARWRGEATVIFGHWSALGLHVTREAICLDTGCVWGRELTAIRLDDRSVFQVPCADSVARWKGGEG